MFGSFSVRASDAWIKIKSDDGVFTAEVPAKYDAFFDKDGFSLSDMSKNVSLENVYIFNSYVSGTLIGFEVFQARDSGFVAGRLREIEASSTTRPETSDIKTADGVKMKQNLIRTPDYYLVRRFVQHSTTVYVLTIASRTGETAESKRFLDSIIIRKKGDPNADADALPLSKLKISPLQLYKKPETSPPPKPTATATPLPIDPNDKKLLILTKPRPSYTNTARGKGESGTVVLQIGFTENGGINEITIKRELDGGLVRQTLFAALRVRILPPEKEGNVLASKRTVEYSFMIR